MLKKLKTLFKIIVNFLIFNRYNNKVGSGWITLIPTQSNLFKIILILVMFHLTLFLKIFNFF